LKKHLPLPSTASIVIRALKKYEKLLVSLRNKPKYRIGAEKYSKSVREEEEEEKEEKEEKVGEVKRQKLT
jgi:hypothetical protein